MDGDVQLITAKNMKALTSELAGVGAIRPPSWGPRDLWVMVKYSG